MRLLLILLPADVAGRSYDQIGSDEAACRNTAALFEVSDQCADAAVGIRSRRKALLLRSFLLPLSGHRLGQQFSDGPESVASDWRLAVPEALGGREVLLR